MSDWQFVWIKAVAKAWADASFEAHLKRDARQALAQAFNFHVPADMSLHVVSSGETTSTGKGQGSLTLVLPNKPDGVDQAIALAEVVHTTAHHCCGQPCA
jgi:ribosomally synthesized peptide (two-chain TOMM family)